MKVTGSVPLRTVGLSASCSPWGEPAPLHILPSQHTTSPQAQRQQGQLTLGWDRWNCEPQTNSNWGWGGGSFRKVIVAGARGPEFNSQHHGKMASGAETQAVTLVMRSCRQQGPRGLLTSVFSQISKLQASWETQSQKGRWREIKEDTQHQPQVSTYTQILPTNECAYKYAKPTK